jgi:anaerobic magnesium-protoporphyrin IX monomethyl ester cyclase
MARFDASFAANLPMVASVDLLLVNPGGRERIYQSLSRQLSAIENPIWAGLLATFVRRRGFSVAILDANAEDLTPTEVAARVAEIAPVLTAVVVYGHNPSAATQVMPAASAICAAIKESTPERKLLLVGGHVAALPQRTLREEQADYVCTGEGGYTLVDLLSALKSDRPHDVGRVRGLLHQRSLTATPTQAPLIKDLEQEMPGIAWDLLPVSRYRAHNWHCFGGQERQPYAAIYTTLGCPYKCTFCCIQAPFKEGEAALGMKSEVNSYRFFSPKTVIKEIETLVEKHGVRNIKFADEMFVLNRRHVLGICDEIIARKYDLNIWAYARVDTVKEGMLDRLRQAGFTWLGFGIEAGSARVRDAVDKSFDHEEIIRTLAAVKAAGINVGGNFIFGLPEDDRATMQETLDLALEVNPEYANFYCAMAYPGSPLYRQALEQGWPLPQEWSGYSQMAVDALPLPTRYLTGAEVLAFRDQAFQSFYSSASYQEMMQRKFGPQVMEELRFMIAHKVERQHRPDSGGIPEAVRQLGQVADQLDVRR